MSSQPLPVSEKRRSARTAAGVSPRNVPRAANGTDADDVFAALDLGTNSCRLLVARPIRANERGHDWHRPYYGTNGMPFRVIDAFSRMVRLGEGLSHTNRLSDHAIERTITALTICLSKMNRRGVTRARCIATAACRQADNCDEFLDRVYRETGLELEIISGNEEATLGLVGCLPLLSSKQSSAIIFDIGGGSTEVSLLTKDANGRFDLAGNISMPFGVVTLTESLGGQMDPSQPRGNSLPKAAYTHIYRLVRDYLQRFDAQHGVSELMQMGQLQIVGTSGTVTTLAGVNMRLKRYDRTQVDGIYMDRRTIFETIAELREGGNRDRAAYPCIGAHRADLVLPGCAILEAICDQWPVDQLRIADRGLREGLLYTLFARLDDGNYHPARPHSGR